MPSRDTMPQMILVAEDQAHIRHLIEYKLKNSGYAVTAVEDGSSALATALAILPDLILLDIMMPLMTGFEVLVALKADARTKKIPVLLVTAQSKEHEVLRGLELGAEDYITKPFSPNELAARVKKALLTRGRLPADPAPGS
ncbi:MAG: response regulator [Bacteroidota bacterium]